MVRKFSITFRSVVSPIREPVTKFGGQPVWLSGPVWPLSRSTGKPMQFIGQVVLDRALFGDIIGQMAYIFMTDVGHEQCDYPHGPPADGTFDFDLGENTILVQPHGGKLEVETRPFASGPSLYRLGDPAPGTAWGEHIPCEFAVELEPGEDPDTLPPYGACLQGEGDRGTLNQIGGTPCFMQGEQCPEGDGWRLLLQLDSTTVPFEVNFGDGGIGYAFLSADGRLGKFAWQSL